MGAYHYFPWNGNFPKVYLFAQLADLVSTNVVRILINCDMVGSFVRSKSDYLILNDDTSKTSCS